MRFHFLIFIASLALIAPVAQADQKPKAKPNCRVELVKEASASSIMISFEADTQEECERAQGPDVQTNFSGDPAAKKPEPKKKK